MAFYIDNCLVASRDLVWLQSSFDVLVGLFEHIGLFTNASKTKVMTFIPGRIREGYTGRITLISGLERKQPPTGSAAGWIVRSVVTAYKLDPSRVIWRHSMTFIIHLS